MYYTFKFLYLSFLYSTIANMQIGMLIRSQEVTRSRNSAHAIGEKLASC